MASLTKSLLRIPVPLFGTAASALTLGAKKATAAPRYAMWALPGAAGAMWFIWPAVSDEFKVSVGMLPDPEASATAATADGSAAKAVELSEEAQEKVDNAYKSHDQIVEEKMSDEEKAVLKAVEKGDFGALDNDWDQFMEKSIKPGEDDDDDDDDDDDEVRYLYGWWRTACGGSCRSFGSLCYTRIYECRAKPVD